MSWERDVKAYCVRCRETVDMEQIVTVTMKNGKKAWKGTCSQCGAVLFKIKPSSREGMW
jgi:hypothetical protein